MIRDTAHRRFFRLLTSVMLLLSITVSLVPAPAHAWKPKTHIFFAEEALKDAIDDGKVTIHKVDYLTGTVVGELGQYDVDADILAALKSHPKQYRAGVLGPDAYPDIITGQRVIHPDASRPDGSNSWLQHLWDSAGSDKGAIKAFVIGYLTHAAGDMYGHTFVNHYTGGEFSLGQNAIKHVVVEGYVGKRTPETISATGITVDEDQVSIEGVEDFIYRTMVRAEAGTVLKNRLLETHGGALPIADGHVTVPYVFSSLRTSLQHDIDDYYNTKATYSRRAAQKGQEAADCGTFDFSCSSVKLRAQQAAILLELGAYVTTEGPVTTYLEYWVDDIDEGLKAWPALSHEVAKALVFNKNGADVRKAQNAVDDYVNDHLLSMAGAPDAVGAARSVIGKVTDAIKPFRDLIDQMKRGLLNFLLKESVGMGVDEIEKYLKNPELHFDPVMQEAGPGEEISLADFNSKVLKITDRGYSHPDQRFDLTQFPAAYNTTTISKLVLLSQSGMNKLLQDLGSSQTLKDPNVMLGFLRSLDGDNQWHIHAQAKMVFSWDCATYRQVFMQQIGEEGGCAVPADGASNLKLDAATAAALDTCRTGLQKLTDNMYEHTQDPSAAASTNQAWKNTYDAFVKDQAPSCDTVGNFVAAQSADPALATIQAAMTADGVTTWQAYWSNTRPPAGSTVFGIPLMGNLMKAYCPAQHLIEADCVTSPQRITKTIAAVNHILDLLDQLPRE